MGFRELGHCMGYAIITPYDNLPAYPRLTEYGAWEAAKQGNGQGNLSAEDLQAQGYRCVRILICPLDRFVE